MKSLDVGPLPICNNGRLAGMVTDRDITVRATCEGADPKSTKVAEVMTKGVIYCFDDDDIREAVSLMEERKVRRMLVLNKDKQLVGIVSLRDLALESDDSDLTSEVLEKVSSSAVH